MRLVIDLVSAERKVDNNETLNTEANYTPRRYKAKDVVEKNSKLADKLVLVENVYSAMTKLCDKKSRKETVVGKD